MIIDGLEIVHRAPERRGYAVIAAPHPLYGGRLDNPVVEALAKGFETEGLGTVRFSYRGVGASAGTASGEIARAAEDYARVLTWLDSQPEAASAPLCLGGYSFGAAAAIAAARASSSGGRVPPHALALVAPPLALLSDSDFASVAAPSFVLMGRSDHFLPLTSARAFLAGIARCRTVEIDADHFFGYELDEVAAFGRTVAASIV